MGHDSDVEKEYEQKKAEHRRSKQNNASWVQKAATSVSEGLEKLFFKLGFAIATRPWTVVLCTFFFSALFGLGMIRFELKDSSEPIWIPEDSPVLSNQKWVEQNFPVKYRYNVIIVTADNILEPETLKQMLIIDEEVKALSELNNSNPVLNFNWTTVCIQLSEQCWSNSLLELWSFDKEKIGSLKNVDEVSEMIDTTAKSPVYQFDFEPEDWLGDVTYDEQGRIVRARAAKMLYVIQATSSDEYNNRIVAPDLLWETRFIDLARKLDKESEGPIRGIDVSAVRSFRDESDNSFEGDVTLLLAGVGVIICYVAIILGKFNEVEHKVYLALVGVFGIGLASLVSYGFASAIGMFYGPIHPILPFLLLGLGVDDMFVIIEAWNNLTALQRRKDLKVKIALAMQHAGVSITVTSVTDFVAFAIGATTTLPALKSFCVYAALGIFSLFIIQSTFFVAWLTIDQRRQDASRDGCCIWIKYVSFEPNRCSQRVFLPWFLRKFFAPLLLSLPIKVLVASILVGMLAISGYGTYLLRTDADLEWFLPRDSYFARFLQTQDRYFDDGVVANLYVGDIDYYKNTERLADLSDELAGGDFVRPNSMWDWQESYHQWLINDATDTAWYLDIELNDDKYPVDSAGYYTLLNAYVGTAGIQHYDDLKWNDTDPHNTRHVIASKIRFTVKKLATSDDDTAALKFFEDTCEKYFPDESFIWAVMFRNWETNRVIQKELYMNIGLAFCAVFIVTLLLVANLLSCIMVCMCVIFTLVNVCGFMHFWGLTIDTLTSILLILSIGLAIDYSAHIGHTFMTIAGTRDERARHTVSTIGPAVLNGGFSTFLAFILLATSNSYVFTTFFKVFFLVVIFGLFNGMCVLPVFLSWLGPPPYLNATNIALTSRMSIKLKTLSSLNESRPVHPKLRTSLSTTQERDTSKPPPENTELKNRLHNVELQKLSEDINESLSMLEAQSENVPKQETLVLSVLNTRPIIEPPKSHEDIIRDCEEYLIANEMPNDRPSV